eukprot:NODE_994_length_2763_cov_0.593844.p1 type:complete len:361 gc:universal NODE_994_length_2763_cov_0.593844:2341-1259(-)
MLWIATLYGVSVDCSSVIPFAQNLNLHLVNKTIWNQLNVDCCSTIGISCITNRVVQISWPNLNLNGSLNGNLASLTSFTGLDISNNFVNGSILVSFPNIFRTLTLTYNHLSGSLENWIISPQLRVLDITGNDFKGPLPTTIPNQMTRIYAEQNQFTGNIPNLPPSFVVLYCGSNLLSGLITNLPPFLTQLSLNNNLFFGDLPIMPNTLTTIYISLNQFTGTFSANKPITMYINNNRFTALNITDYSALLQGRCSIDQNPLKGSFNLPSSSICAQNSIYSLASSTTYSIAVQTSTILTTSLGVSTLQSTYFSTFEKSTNLPFVSSSFTMQETTSYEISSNKLAQSSTTALETDAQKSSISN